MKKLILFIVLILGFINENKAQFAASSEMYYYVDIDPIYFDWKNGALKVWCVKFYSDRLSCNAFGINTLNDLNNLNFDHVYLYDEKLSNHKYFVYRCVHRQDWAISSISYIAISKNGEECIYWSTWNGKTNGRIYTKRVTINEIKALLKPQFDFLE